MTHALNETHTPELSSWVESANAAGCDFPVQNLPFAIFRRAGSNEPFRAATAIGDQVLDIGSPAVHAALKLDATTAEALTRPALNNFMALGNKAWSALRLALSRALRTGSKEQAALQAQLVPQSQVEYALPAQIGDYTDFYTSIHHATTIGKLFRPDNPLLPNYKWVPIGYHGRSSSIQVAPHSFHRPRGQTMPLGTPTPVVQASRKLDVEFELGVFIGTGNDLGEPIAIDEAESHVFGIAIFNDWSARDIQPWEYQPLGPFIAKNFASTVSPWIVTLEALAPFRRPYTRPEGDPQPLPYLDSEANRAGGAFDVQLQIDLQTAKGKRTTLSRTSYRHAYWTVAQMVAHHTVGGCNLRPGDLLATGTLSGPTAGEACSLIELTQNGKNPFAVGDEQRTFLEDGDTALLSAWCEQPGAARIGFGVCAGTVLPAKS